MIDRKSLFEIMDETELRDKLEMIARMACCDITLLSMQLGKPHMVYDIHINKTSYMAEVDRAIFDLFKEIVDELNEGAIVHATEETDRHVQ